MEFRVYKLGKGEQLIIQKMHEEGRLNNGESTGRALGLQIRSYKGLQVVGSAGSGFGYRAQLMRFPDENFSIIILANREDADPTKMAHQMADLLLKSSIESNAMKMKVKTDLLTNAKEKKVFTLNQLVGDYEVQPDRAAEITVQNDMLHVLQKWDGTAYPVVNTVGNTYEIPNYSGMQLVFSDLEGGSTQKIKVFLNGSEFIFKRKEKVDLPRLNLDDFTGNYCSDELDATFLLLHENGVLKLKIADYDPIELTRYNYHLNAFYFNDDLLRFQ